MRMYFVPGFYWGILGKKIALKIRDFGMRTLLMHTCTELKLLLRYYVVAMSKHILLKCWDNDNDQQILFCCRKTVCFFNQYTNNAATQNTTGRSIA